MEKNVGKIDQIVRIVVAIIIAYLDFSGIITGTLSYVLSIFAVVFLITGFVKFCPLYKLLGINSCNL